MHSATACLRQQAWRTLTFHSYHIKGEKAAAEEKKEKEGKRHYPHPHSLAVDIH